MCELMNDPGGISISTTRPDFSWIMNSQIPGDHQTAWQILVASNSELLDRNSGDMWDSGKIDSDNSVQAAYKGSGLKSGNSYWWKVRLWNKKGEVSPFSEAQKLFITPGNDDYRTDQYLLEKTEIKPARIHRKNNDHFFFDFGRAAFGTVSMRFSPVSRKIVLEVLLGEQHKSRHSVQRKPRGNIRYQKIQVQLEPGQTDLTVIIPPDDKNTRSKAIHMPDYIGEVTPFRYCELINCPSGLDEHSVRQIAVHYPFNDNASSFKSSNHVLNDVWDLCKYSIKATTFCGLYVDGDRERVPYEADAYINQLGHYCVDREFTMARATHEYLIRKPTWPTEWILHSVLMAWADYLYTGNSESITHYYSDLKAKTLISLAREDGLISTTTGLLSDDVLKSIYFEGEIRDIVDWPPASYTKGGKGERDDYVMTDINTTVNAFHFRALELMARIAGVTRHMEDSLFFQNQAEKVKQAINEKLFDRTRLVYTDGEGTDHASLHANMFPLAFGLVPEEHVPSVLNFIQSRGMACSVYGVQYLLEALYQAGADQYGLELMTASHDRSWPHMIYNVGTTITLEAWDWKYKNNLDWNHAWGAAPANIIPRYLMGVRPLIPGFREVLIQPQVGDLKEGRITVPTIRGAIHLAFKNRPETSFELNVTLPANMTAKVMLPKMNNNNPGIIVNGLYRKGEIEGNWIILDRIGSGTTRFQRKIN
ncbi:hypothetical protein BVY01_03540 [bacterium I07]|nr:hypothetical protein BVY01_03540 [bacterium I07]